MSEAPSLVEAPRYIIIRMSRSKVNEIAHALLGNLCNLYNLPIENQLSYLPMLHWIDGLGELVAN